MNARTSLLTVTLTLSLIVPAAAGAQIPRDSSSTVTQQPKVHRHTLAASSSAISGRAYNPWGYVQGGASPKVAKAIMADANSRATLGQGAYNGWGAYVPGGSSQKVAQAIAAAATTRTASSCIGDAQRRVPC